MVLLGYDFKIETESLEHRFDDYAAGAVQRCIDNLWRFGLTNHLWIQNERFEPMHVRFVDILAYDCYLALSVFW